MQKVWPYVSEIVIILIVQQITELWVHAIYNLTS